MATIERQIEKVVSGYLEDYSFEELLEEFDLDPPTVFLILFENGHIDETLLDSFLTGE